MNRIAKSEQFCQALEEVLFSGKSSMEHPLDSFIRLGARYMLQVALEQEVLEFLGRGHYQRGHRINDGYRNGYKPRNLKSANGILQVAIPQVRDTDEDFRSKLVKKLKKGSDVLNKLVTEMYVRGLSCADVENSFLDIFGRKIISRSGVSKITEHLTGEFDSWRKRDLSKQKIIYLFLDGSYLAMRQGTTQKEGVLCAYGITADGRKVLLHLGVGQKESTDAWTSFLHDMIERGLSAPLLIIHDGNPGLCKSIQEVFPKSYKQRCQVHKMRNILSKLPDYAIAEIKPMIWEVFRAENYEDGMTKGKKLIAKYRNQYPSAMECLEKDLAETLTALKFPQQHHRFIRTTNLLERTIEEEKRRTKIIPRFKTEKSCLKLVFAVLIRVSQNWNGLKMTPQVISELAQIRRTIGIEDTVSDGEVRQPVQVAAVC
ncbi:MAG: IS256 family transposase [Planctomycetota bacterium]|nr:IS256 family transposase [Planctomycetota bacterium]